MKATTDKTTYTNLISELSTNRVELHKILERIVKFRDKLEALLPDTNDYRNKRLNEERMKTFTEIIKSELDVHKTIDSSIKTEVELRRKIDSDEEEGDVISGLDIHNIANEVERRIKNVA